MQWASQSVGALTFVTTGTAPASVWAENAKKARAFTSWC